MATRVIMPQGGQDIEVGSVVRWLKKEGDRVKKGEVICEVETEKAVFEVEAPEDGFLKKIVVKEGQQAPIFSVIGIVGKKDEAIDVDAILAEGKKEKAGPDISKVRARLETIKGQAVEKVSITPRAKKLAMERGVPISSIKGSGPGGRIKEEDVLGFSQGGPSETDLSSAEYINGGRKVPMTKVRKVIARKMRKSKQVVPHFYVSVSVVMAGALQFLAEFNETLDNPEEESLSVNDLIIRACALCLEEFPQLNSSVLDEENIVHWDDINIGIAVGLDTGLVVPVLENADRLQLPQIGRETRHLVEMARAGKQVSLAPGRFTISNMGMFHVDNFIAIINYPETAILAIASIEKKVVALDGGSIGLRDMMTITLSVDHQVVDGMIASRFINKVKFHLENPKSLL
ncbi:MAG: 2-oxo acid dehydrogenase subunit E2 [Deltaproteobacteria bacterium]|nr:2-oxo acid dehydrogenase subunit E2 [Deltaproteobacteria bacterium]